MIDVLMQQRVESEIEAGQALLGAAGARMLEGTRHSFWQVIGASTITRGGGGGLPSDHPTMSGGRAAAIAAAEVWPPSAEAHTAVKHLLHLCTSGAQAQAENAPKLAARRAGAQAAARIRRAHKGGARNEG